MLLHNHYVLVITNNSHQTSSSQTYYVFKHTVRGLQIITPSILGNDNGQYRLRTANLNETFNQNINDN